LEIVRQLLLSDKIDADIKNNAAYTGHSFWYVCIHFAEEINIMKLLHQE
jgi:hypothetical protein